jgi:hypothetical protein
MTRRDVVAILALSSSALAFRSCQEQKSDLAAQLESIGRAMTALLNVAGHTELAQRFQQNVNFTVALLRSWTPGRDVVEIIRHINELIDIIEGAPGLDRWRPLVTFALGTLAAIIEKLRSVSANAGEAPHTKVRLTAPPQSDAEVKTQWDSIRAGSPGQEQAPVL